MVVQAARSQPPVRGEVWMTDLGGVTQGPDGRKVYARDYEHLDRRPCVVLSNNRFNASSARLVIVVPMTSKNKPMLDHVRIDPPEGGVPIVSFVICEGVRSVARKYLERRMGTVSPRTIHEIEVRIRNLMDF